MKRVAVVLVLAGVVSAVLLVLHPAAAAPGELDPTFGTAGTVRTPIGKDALVTALALQPDGKIVAAGTSDSSFALARYTPSGLLDPGFGSGGTVSGPRGNGDAISLQADGKILFGGGQFIESRGARLYFTLARFHPDGRLDTSFADGGLFTGPEGRVSDVAVQSDGKILLAGASAYGFELVRLEPDGTPDTGFGSDGAVHTLHGANAGASAILVQPSGKIVAAGASTPGTAPPPPPPPPAPPPPPPPGPPPEPFRITLVRYDADGSLDSTFGSAGFSDTSLGYSARADDAVLEPDGKMLVVGPTDERAYGPRRLFVARYAPDGTPDATFASGGAALAEVQPGGWRNWMALQPDGKIVVAGAFGVARLRGDGTLDPTFGSGGVAQGPVAALSLALQPDGRIVVGGFMQTIGADGFALNRYFARAPTTLVAAGVVGYGRSSPVRGTVPGGSAGVRVDVLGRACYGFKTRVVATAITRAGGTWHANVRPRSRTDYTARVGIETTPTLVVQVRPKVTLTKVANGGFRVRVLAAHSLGGQVVLLQRRVGGRWVSAKRLVLRRTGRQGKSVVSGRSFSVPGARGRGLRALYKMRGRDECYVTAASRPILG